VSEGLWKAAMVAFEVAGSARANEIAPSKQQIPAPRLILMVMSRLRPERRGGFDRAASPDVCQSRPGQHRWCRAAVLRVADRRRRLFRLGRREPWDALLLDRVIDEPGEASLARLGFLRAADPKERDLAVAGRLRLKELPRFRFGAEAFVVGRVELRVLALLVGVDDGAVVGARCEGFEAGGRHAFAVRCSGAREHLVACGSSASVHLTLLRGFR